MLVGWGCAGGCVVWVGAFPISGGGMIVGWYPVGMWLLVGLGVPFASFLHALLLWLLLLQWLQNTLSVMHSCLMWPCSPHLKHIGPFLLLAEFGESLKNPLRPDVLVVLGGKVVCVDAFPLLFFLHTLLWSVVLVVLVRNYPTGAVPALWIIKSFAGDSYQPLWLVVPVIE